MSSSLLLLWAIGLLGLAAAVAALRDAARDGYGRRATDPIRLDDLRTRRETGA